VRHRPDRDPKVQGQLPLRQTCGSAQIGQRSLACASSRGLYTESEQGRSVDSQDAGHVVEPMDRNAYPAKFPTDHGRRTDA
jgi:hypothetical protein